MSEQTGWAADGRDVYVHIGRGAIATTKQVSESVSVDLDGGGRPAGVEILGAIGVDVDGKPVVPPSASDPGHHVSVTVDPGRNHGRPSLTRGMTPIWSVLGSLNAGDTPETVQEEWGLDGGQLALVVALAEDVRDLTLREQDGDAVEVVARALHEERKRHSLCDDASHTWHAHKPEARAAIAVAPKPTVTRQRVRDAATALFMWNNELPGEPRFVLRHVTGGCDREPYGALIDEVLHHLGIAVRD